MLVQLCSHLNK